MDSYYGNVNPQLLDIIPDTALRIIEFGCGSGAFLKALQERNPDRALLGFEINPQQAEQARAKGLDVITGNIEQQDLGEQLHKRGWGAGHRPDCLVFGDVLEHLHNPWGFLRETQKQLADGGFLAVCIPNIQHWTVVNGLMKGQFSYEKSGILDVTHLRFFTRNSIEHLIVQAGYEIVKGVRRIWMPEGSEEFFDKAADFITDPSMKKDMQTLQYVSLARKSSSR